MFGYRMSKNFLVFKNYNITDHTKWYNDRTSEIDLVDNYKAMEKIATASALKNVERLNEIKVFRGEATDIREVFKKNFYEIYELWQQGNNILYADLDVIFTQPVDYFASDNIFRMYNLTDPAQTSCDHYNVQFDAYFNCGIRYYPKDMSQEVWDLGIKMVENWNSERWDSEQIIYNAMLWSQDIQPDDVYDPRVAYQCLHDPAIVEGNRINKQFNQIDLNEAQAVHVHGSRGSSDRLFLMENFAEGKIPQLEETLFL